MAEQDTRFRATGKRKSAIARVILIPGGGGFRINRGRAFEDYFPDETLRRRILKPFRVTETEGQFDVQCRLDGGGISGQADALRHGISRALLEVSDDYRKPLKVEGLLTRDARIKERKKYGQPGARKRYQYSKR